MFPLFFEFYNMYLKLIKTKKLHFFVKFVDSKSLDKEKKVTDNCRFYDRNISLMNR